MSPRPVSASLAYAYGENLYLNVTNRCPTACRFCAKQGWDWSYRGHLLRLPREPSTADLVDAARRGLRENPAQEAVFCGFGEPTERLDVVLETARALRASHPGVKLRLNTIGLGSLSWGRDIVGDLALRLDAVSVSLNAANPSLWAYLHRPRRAWADDSFEAVCAFIAGCVRAGLETTATAVELPEVDLKAVEALALSLGARFRARPRLL